MSYNSWKFLLIFLPAVAIVYQLVPKKYRWIVLLSANYVFFFVWSNILVLYQVAETIVTYLFGRKLGSMGKAPEGMDRKAYKKKKHRILALAILINLAVLIVLKYANFIGQNVSALFNNKYSMLKLLVSVGISYYTLQNISYLADVANKKNPAQENPFKLALYTSFFGTILEGPITRYGDIANDLLAGSDITPVSFTQGVQRIAWGVFQKMMIADRLAPVVNKIFSTFSYSGSLALLGAVLCTIQLYTDFAGTIDIAIGAAKIFNITITENFRQPFFAKNASDFWRRWHITLGTFLRDYIFYPVSLSKPIQKMTKFFKAHNWMHFAKYAGPTIALFFVWAANGFWHGTEATYIVYGMYYFVFMVIEMHAEKPFEAWCEKHHWDVNGAGVRTFRFIKLFFIVIMGEMIFRAEKISVAFLMASSIFTNFHINDLAVNFSKLILSNYDWIVAAGSFVIVILHDVLKEKNYPMREKYESMPRAMQVCLFYGLILVIIFFGAYGAGYDPVAMMYAGF